MQDNQEYRGTHGNQRLGRECQGETKDTISIINLCGGNIMGAVGYTIFCRKGHIVQTVLHRYTTNYDEGICNICNSNETYKCFEWGDAEYGPHCIPYTPSKNEYIDGLGDVAVFDVSMVPQWHISTRDKRHKCKDCGKEFLLSGREIDFFTRRKLYIPVRCKVCREDINRRKRRRKFCEEDCVHLLKISHGYSKEIRATGCKIAGKQLESEGLRPTRCKECPNKVA